MIGVISGNQDVQPYRVIKAIGHLDSLSAESGVFLNQTSQSEDNINQHTVFDLSETQYINSSNLGVLLHYHVKAKERGYRAIIYSPSPLLRSIIEMTGIHHILPIVDSIDEIHNLLRQNS